MTWVRKDDQMPINRKVAALSDAAYRLDDEAICWASRNTTDGRIPADEFGEISKRATPKNAAELVRRNRWHRASDPPCPSAYCADPGPDGWVIHDYLEYNPSRDQVLADRKAKADRQARWRDKRRNGSASTHASTETSPEASRNGGGDALVTPAPSRPVPPRPERAGGTTSRSSLPAAAGDGGAAGSEKPTTTTSRPCGTCGNPTDSPYHRNVCAKTAASVA